MSANGREKQQYPDTHQGKNENRASLGAFYGPVRGEIDLGQLIRMSILPANVPKVHRVGVVVVRDGRIVIVDMQMRMQCLGTEQHCRQEYNPQG